MTEEKQGSNKSWNKFKAVCCSCCRKKDEDVVAEMPEQDKEQESGGPTDVAFRSNEQISQSKGIPRAVKSNSEAASVEKKGPNRDDNMQDSFLSHKDSVEVVKERAKKEERPEDGEEDVKQPAAEEEQKQSLEPEVERKASSPNSVKEKASNLVRKISESIRKEKSKGSLADAETKKDPS